MTREVARNYPAWARSLIDPASFEHEQTRLGQIWTLLGVATDAANDGDWFRTVLGGRSIFAGGARALEHIVLDDEVEAISAAKLRRLGT